MTPRKAVDPTLLDDLRIYLHGIYVLEETRELTRFITVESLRNCLAEFGAAVQTSPNQATTTIILGDLDRDTRSAQWAGSRAETVFHKEVERREARGGQEDIDLYESLSDFIDAYQGSGLRESVAAHAFIADFRHDERLKKPSRDPGPSRSSRYLVGQILKDKAGKPILGLKSLID